VQHQHYADDDYNFTERFVSVEENDYTMQHNLAGNAAADDDDDDDTTVVASSSYALSISAIKRTLSH